jgi:DNA-directed RNA polymerase specialized sigma24 family protein
MDVARKIAGALALLAVRGLETDDAALKLDSIGFSASEIAALLDVNSNYVQVARFRRRKAGQKKKS